MDAEHRQIILFCFKEWHFGLVGLHSDSHERSGAWRPTPGCSAMAAGSRLGSASPVLTLSDDCAGPPVGHAVNAGHRHRHHGNGDQGGWWRS